MNNKNYTINEAGTMATVKKDVLENNLKDTFDKLQELAKIQGDKVTTKELYELISNNLDKLSVSDAKHSDLTNVSRIQWVDETINLVINEKPKKTILRKKVTTGDLTKTITDIFTEQARIASATTDKNK